MSTPSEDGVMTLAMDWVRQHLVGRAGTGGSDSKVNMEIVIFPLYI